jgi:hypothetical protein
MTVLSAIRDRLTGPQTPADPDPSGEPVKEADLPFAGYNRLGKRQAMDSLSDHSQVELEAVEEYERSHKDRGPVLTKLHYMRGREPLPGYDALSVEEIRAALEGADMAAIKRVRGYERKFGNRPDVLEEVARVHHQRQADEPKTAAPGYQPLGGAIASSAPVDGPNGGPS